MIVVSGSAGKTGLAVIEALARADAAVRGLVRDEARAGRVLGAGAHSIVSGDMEEAATWHRALQGADALYLIAPNMHPRETTIGRLALDAARHAGLAHVVYHSVLHSQTQAMPHHWQKLRVEEMLFASHLPFTILQPAAYMQNILGSWQAIVEEGVYRVPYPVETRMSLVHLRDVAGAAAKILLERGHEGAIYELAGTRPLAQTEVAAFLGEGLGREVRAEALDRDTWREEAQGRGLSDYALETLLAMFHYYAAHGFVGNPNVLTWLLNRDPTSLATFASENVST